MLHRMTPMVLIFLLACLPSMANEITSTWRVDLTKAVETKEPEELKMLAAHERAEVRAAAAQRLPAVVGSESLDLLAKMSIDEDERVGIAATGSLLDLQDPQVVPALKKVFEVGQPDVIRELVIRLGERQDDRFMPELAALLGSDDTNVRAGVLTSDRACQIHRDALSRLASAT